MCGCGTGCDGRGSADKTACWLTDPPLCAVLSLSDPRTERRGWSWQGWAVFICNGGQLPRLAAAATATAASDGLLEEHDSRGREGIKWRVVDSGIKRQKELPLTRDMSVDVMKVTHLSAETSPSLFLLIVWGHRGGSVSTLDSQTSW